METKLEVVEYYAATKIGRHHLSLFYSTTRPVNDNWGTTQSEPEFFLNRLPTSRSKLHSSITAEVIAQLIATASVVERRVVKQSA